MKAAEQTSLQLIQQQQRERLLAIKVCALEPTSFSSGRLTQRRPFFWLREIGNPPARIAPSLRWQAGIPLRADAFDLFVSTFGLVISPPSSCFIHKSITAILLSTRATAPSPHPHYQFLSTLKIHFGLFLSSPKRAAKVFTPALKSARGGKRVEERKKKRAGENLIQITRSNRKLLSLSPSSRSGGRRRTRAATRLLSPKRGLPACSGFLM